MLSFFTAAKIAKWMAKSYGFRANKKHEYTSQDQVWTIQHQPHKYLMANMIQFLQILVQNKRKEAFDELTLSVPNLLDPNENDEEASRAASALGGRFLQVSMRVRHVRSGFTIFQMQNFKGSSGESPLVFPNDDLRLGRGRRHDEKERRQEEDCHVWRRGRSPMSQISALQEPRTLLPLSP